MNNNSKCDSFLIRLSRKIRFEGSFSDYFLYLCPVMNRNFFRIYIGSGGILFLLVILSQFTSCARRSVTSQLVRIDTLLQQDKPDSALLGLSQIHQSMLKDKDDYAYYCLLKTQTLYRLYKPIGDSLIDISVKHYKAIEDRNKLARAYYYKGSIMYTANDRQGGTKVMKDAEQLVRYTDPWTAYKIYERLADINFRQDISILSISYARQALRYANLLHNADWQLYSMNMLAENYKCLNKSDSVDYFIKQCLPLIGKSTGEFKTYFLSNIGEFYIKKNPRLAAHYFKLAMRLSPDVQTCHSIAKLYYSEGMTDKAMSLWNKAVQTDDVDIKWEILRQLFEVARKEGKKDKALEVAGQLIALQDSVRTRDTKDTLWNLQTKYDQTVAEQSAFLWEVDAVGAVICAMLVIVSVVLYARTHYERLQKQLSVDREEINTYNRRIAELEREKQTDRHEITTLYKKIEEVKERHSGILANGNRLYDELMGGGSTVRWTRQDFKDFIEYYKLKDLPLVNRLESEYKSLSARQMTMAILMEKGKDDEKISALMGVGDSAVRMTRHRIRKNKIG